MNYFPRIMIILLLYTCETVFGANVQAIKTMITAAAGLVLTDKLSLGNLTIEVKKTNYYNKIPRGLINPKTYNYKVGDTLELKCEKTEPVNLEWTDEKNKISQKSCSEIKDFTLKLEHLGYDDNLTTFTCNSTNEYNTVTLVLDRTDLSRSQVNNSKICYKIKRNSQNCSHYLRQETVRRVSTVCPTNMIEVSSYHNGTKPGSVEDIATGFGAESLEVSGNSFTLLHAGVIVLVFMSLTITTFCIFKCYKKVKERNNNEPIYAEPNEVVYAELQVINDNSPKLPNRNDPPYAQIVGILTPE